MTSYAISKTAINMRAIVEVVGAALFIALCAQISIPLFFTPVPLSMATLGTMLVGGILGAKKGVASVLLRLGMGAMGLPVFSNLSFGMDVLLGVQGGYLIGQIVQVYLVGWYVENFSRSSVLKTLCMLVAFCFIQMGLGVLWLGNFVGWSQVLLMGFYPFIPGEILKSLAVSKYLSSRS